MISVSVRYYNRLRELACTPAEKVQLDEGATVADLVTRIICSRPVLASFRDSLLTARNNEYIAANGVLHDGDSIDLMPPVSGG